VVQRLLVLALLLEQLQGPSPAGMPRRG
jgi:hypothetical protein